MSELEQQKISESPEKELPGKKKKNKKVKEKRPLWQEILSWVLTLLCAFAAALVIRSVIFEPVRVDGASMNDTLADGEIMFVSKFDYSSTWLSMPWQSDEEKQQAPRLTLGGNPNRFDVVICRYPGRGDLNFVKRVIGLPGDTVELNNGILFVNGEQYDEAYVNDEYRTGSLNTFGPATVPAKGDTVTVRETEGGYALWLNDTEWDYRVMRNGITVTDGDGKKMEITGGGGITYDGTQVTATNAAEMLQGLTEKTFTVRLFNGGGEPPLAGASQCGVAAKVGNGVAEVLLKISE